MGAEIVQSLMERLGGIPARARPEHASGGAEPARRACFAPDPCSTSEVRCPERAVPPPGRGPRSPVSAGRRAESWRAAAPPPARSGAAPPAPPDGAPADRLPQVAVESLELPLQPAGAGLDAGTDRSGRRAVPVPLDNTHPEHVPAAGRQGGKRPALSVRERAERRADCRTNVREGLGVGAVGLRRPSGGARDVSHLQNVGEDRLELGRERDLRPAAGLQDPGGRTQSAEPVDGVCGPAGPWAAVRRSSVDRTATSRRP